MSRRKHRTKMRKMLCDLELGNKFLETVGWENSGFSEVQQGEDLEQVREKYTENYNFCYQGARQLSQSLLRSSALN